MSRAKHTFAVCAYKENPYLEEAVKSVVNQTVKSEVIIVTGTPNDYIGAIADKYNIPVIVNKAPDAATMAGNLNFAIESAKTDLITPVHQDDYYESDYAKEILKGAAGRHPIIIFTEYFELRGGERVYKNRLLKVKELMNLGFRLFPSSRFVRKRVLSLGCPICCPAVAFSKKMCKGFRFDGDYLNNIDWDAWIRLADRKGDYICIHKPLVGHRIHEGSGTTESINNGIRHRENMNIYRRFWPDWLAKRLIKLYEFGDRSNNI